MAQQSPADWVNFAQLKEKISFPQLLEHFDLAKGLSQEDEELQGSCPICGNEGFKVNLEKNSFSCPGCKKRGSVIDFVSVYKKVGLKEAGKLLKGILEASAKPPVKEPRGPGKTKRRKGKESGKPNPAPAFLTQAFKDEIVATAQALDTELKEAQGLTAELMTKLEKV